MSQNPDTKDYIMVLEYAKSGNFNDWANENYKYFNWESRLHVLSSILEGLKDIHRGKIVHCDFHTGNILFNISEKGYLEIYISDMGLCEEIDNTDKTKIYGV